MTREDYIKMLEENRAKAEEAVAAYNAATVAEDVKAQKEAADVIEQAVKEYANISKTLAFDFCEKSPDPMIAAVTMLTYTVIAAKDTKVGDGASATTILELREREKYIPLKELNSRVKGGIGVDKNWPYMIENMNMRLTAKVARSIGCPPEKLTEISDSFAMNEISKTISLGTGADPCSKNQLVKTLRNVISAMIGEDYPVQAKDVDFLIRVYSKHGKSALSVACANNNKFTQYIAEICHAIILNKDYGIEYKAKK